MQKNYRLRFCLMLTSMLLLFAMIITSSLAWFTTLKDINRLGFSGGNIGEFTIYEITYDDSSSAAQTVRTVGTVGDAFDIAALQFGRISNLSTLINSNYIYYAVKIPKGMGDKVNLGISHGESTADALHFDIFVPQKDSNGDYILDANGNISTSLLTDADTLAKLAAIETDSSDTFISHSFAISEKAPAEFSAIADMDALFKDIAPAPLVPLDGSGIPTQTTRVFETAALEGNYYYVYIKLQPNISLYKYFIDYLWADMPFCLAYDIRMYMTVTS